MNETSQPHFLLECWTNSLGFSRPHWIISAGLPRRSLLCCLHYLSGLQLLAYNLSFLWYKGHQAGTSVYHWHFSSFTRVHMRVAKITDSNRLQMSSQGVSVCVCVGGWVVEGVFEVVPIPLFPWKKSAFPFFPKSKSWLSLFSIPLSCLLSPFPSFLDSHEINALFSLFPETPGRASVVDCRQWLKFSLTYICMKNLSVWPIDLELTYYYSYRLIQFSPHPRWAASSEKLPSNMRKMSEFRSSYACAKYHPDFIHHSYIVKCPIILSAISEGPDQTAQVDLGLRCPHMFEDIFSQGHCSDYDTFGHMGTWKILRSLLIHSTGLWCSVTSYGIVWFVDCIVKQQWSKWNFRIGSQGWVFSVWMLP